MVASGRSDEARQLLKTYQQNYPAELQDLQRTSSARAHLPILVNFCARRG
jgi:geranylgeranyl pyrophosphate synthase